MRYASKTSLTIACSRTSSSATCFRRALIAGSGFPVPAVVGEIEQGSVWSSRILLTGVLFIIAAFVSTHETDLWETTDKLLVPLLTMGVSLILLDVLLRMVRPKLQVTLLGVNVDQLNICPVKNLQFSGWTPGKPRTVAITDISSVKAYDFYNPGTKTAMFWICLEFTNKNVIEFNIDNPALVKQIIAFFESLLPSVAVTVDVKIKT